MKRILFILAAATLSLPAAASDALVEMGRLSVPDVPIEFGAVAHLPDWSGRGGRRGPPSVHDPDRRRDVHRPCCLPRGGRRGPRRVVDGARPRRGARLPRRFGHAPAVALRGRNGDARRRRGGTAARGRPRRRPLPGEGARHVGPRRRGARGLLARVPRADAGPAPGQPPLGDARLRAPAPPRLRDVRRRRAAPYSARSTIVASSGNGPNASRRPSGQGTTSNSSTRISPASPSRDTSALTP